MISVLVLSINTTKGQGCVLTDTVLLDGFCFSARSVGASGSIGNITIVPLFPQIPGNPPPYSYSINGLNGPFNTPATDSVFTNVTAGTYDIVVVDIANPTCTDSIRIIIPEPQDPLTTLVSVNSDLDCYGDTSGVATVNTIGGVLPYSYQWPSGENTQQANGLWEGLNQHVFVTDANGCMDSALFDISYLYDPFSVVLDTIQQVQCFGECNGEVSLNTSGAVPPYTFSWSNGQTYLGPGTDTAYGLCQGGYSVIIQDAYGCDTTVSFSISEPTELFAQAISIQPVQCFGFDDGIAYSFGVGGASPYEYSWDSMSGTNDTINSLNPGIHTVLITDTNDCTASDTVLITEPDQLVVEIIDSLAIYSYCLGTNSGELCAVASGGTPAYNYAWDNGAQLSSCAINLAAGQYTVSVIDDRSCFASDSFDLDSISNTMIEDSVDIDVIPITCNALYNGSITINSVGGGIGPFSFSWNGPGTFSQNGVGFSSNISSLYEGTYSVIIEDANGCIINTDADVQQPDFLEYSIDYVNDESCSGDGPLNGSCNGEVILNINGGTSPYYYDNSFSGAFPMPLANQDLVFQDSLISGFCDGIYDIHITDSNGCQGYVVWGGSFTANIGEGFIVYIPGVKTIDASCFNTDDGVAWVETGGDPALNYTWESTNGAVPSGVIIDTSSYTDGLLPGDYFLVAHFSDSLSFGQNYSGCDVWVPFTMESPSPILSGALVTNVTCFGDTDGSIDLSPIGDEPPFTFLWDTLLSIPYNNITIEDHTQLSPGVYTVNITDATGCVLTESINVWEPNPIITNFNITNVSCHGLGDGEATAIVNPNSGAAPFTYFWNTNPSQFTQTASGLEGGVYTVLVTDSNGFGCSASFNVTIVEPAPVIALAEANSFYGEDDLGNPYHIKCFGQSNGSLIVSISGGTGAVNYEWQSPPGNIVSTNQNTGPNLPAGNYLLEAIDANGCVDDTTITLSQPNLLEANVTESSYISGTNISCFDLYDGWALSEPTGGYTGPSDYQYSWKNNLSEIVGQQDSAFNLPAGFSYTITVTDANGCTDLVTTNIFTQPVYWVADVITTNYAGPTHNPFSVNFIDNTVLADPYYFDWTWAEGIESFASGTSTFDHEFVQENVGLNNVYVVLTNETTLCTDTNFFLIDVQGIPEINNVFTPNNDGINDSYSFNEHKMEKIAVQIFNRWGQQVYAWEGIDKSWRGVDINGQDVAEGAYFYVLEADGEDGHHYTEKGTITLLR